MFSWLLFSSLRDAPPRIVTDDMAFERRRAQELRRIRDAKEFTRRTNL